MLDCEDVMHYRVELNFEVPIILEEGEYVTGHIDLLQIRNGMVHILNNKPSAKKVKPVNLSIDRYTSARRLVRPCTHRPPPEDKRPRMVDLSSGQSSHLSR